MEVAVLKRLQKSSPHICEFLGCGRNDKVNYVVMTLLGPSLSELRKHQPHQRFSISTTLRTSLQILAAVQSMHNCGFIHRDIKPSNFAIGFGPENCRTCYMLDYGLARQYTTVTGEVRQPRPVAGFRGTVRYASHNAHLSRDLGRHDDLWSVFYLLVELAVGQLPWRRIRDKEEAGELKAQYDHQKLIRGLPVELGSFLDHLKCLTYFDKPDYSLVTGALQKATKRLGIQESDLLDWEQDCSGPSMTTASVVSTPALKVIEEEKSMAKELPSHEPSRTNCSDVEDFGEKNSSNQQKQSEHSESISPMLKHAPVTNGLPEAPHELQYAHQKQPVKTFVLNAQKSSDKEGSEGASTSKQDLHRAQKEAMLEEAMLEENVQIDNHYISEDSDDNEDNDKVSEISSEHLPPSQSSPVLDVKVVTQSDSPDSSRSKQILKGTPLNGAAGLVKTYLTDSLNRFFDMSIQISKSYKSSSNSCSMNKPDLESASLSHDGRSLSGDGKDELNNAVIYPDDCMDQEFAVVGFIAPPPDQKEMDSFERNSKDIIAHSRNERSKENLVTSIHDSIRESKLVEESGALHESESSISKSVRVTSTQKELNLTMPTAPFLESNKEERLVEEHRNIDESGGKIIGRSRNQIKAGKKTKLSSLVSSQGGAKQTKSITSKQDQEAPSMDIQECDTDKTGPARFVQQVHMNSRPPSLIIQQVDKSKSEPSANVREVKEQMDRTKTSSSAQDFDGGNPNLEVVPSPVILRPRPPPNPPPKHYSQTLLARRRRFVRALGQKDNQ